MRAVLRHGKTCASAKPRHLGRKTGVGRIEEALQSVAELVKELHKGDTKVYYKNGREAVTNADRAINRLLRKTLPRQDEGWLSEESPDSLIRLKKRQVWVVDPLDGTQEFLSGVPEWCVSIGLVQDRLAVAGGVLNPSTGEIVLGSVETGLVTKNVLHPFNSPQVRRVPLVLASRTELHRGDWQWLRGAPLEVRPVGSIAYKLALVAAGLADATWTFTPKHEWDVAAGVALIQASGGTVLNLAGRSLAFNQVVPRFEGLWGFSRTVCRDLYRILAEHLPAKALEQNGRVVGLLAAMDEITKSKR